MEDKIILKFKTKNILNFYEIEPCYSKSYLLNNPTSVAKNLEPQIAANFIRGRGK